ncbi:MAG: hypothetical protein GOU98_03975 [Candidatus Altiarchaeota archaeon]|nr:hypothetical protein [Candidatus Altiarchaeota archaeon]
MIDLKIEDVKKVVANNNYKKVIVLLPAGVMTQSIELSKVIPTPYFMSNPCYGACDVPMHLIEKFDADAIFNFAHSRPIKFPTYPKNVHFFEIQVIRDTSPFVPKFDNIGLIYVIQFKESYAKYKEFLELKGKTVVLGELPDFMATHPGQITGCDVGAAKKIIDKVDGFVVACDGFFHSNAVAVLGKPTYNWNGEKATAPKFPIAKLFISKKIGIITGTKPGQSYLKEANAVKTKLESQGKQVIMVIGDVITQEINNYDVEFWITATCPRMAEDEYLTPSAPVHEVLKYL